MSPGLSLKLSLSASKSGPKPLGRCLPRSSQNATVFRSRNHHCNSLEDHGWRDDARVRDRGHLTAARRGATRNCGTRRHGEGTGLRDRCRFEPPEARPERDAAHGPLRHGSEPGLVSSRRRFRVGSAGEPTSSSIRSTAAESEEVCGSGSSKVRSAAIAAAVGATERASSVSR